MCEGAPTLKDVRQDMPKERVFACSWLPCNQEERHVPVVGKGYAGRARVAV